MPYIPRTVAPQVARSFDTWAANHKKIYFTDVTAQCTNATDNVCAAAEVCEHASLPHVLPSLRAARRSATTTRGGSSPAAATRPALSLLDYQSSSLRQQKAAQSKRGGVRIGGCHSQKGRLGTMKRQR